MTAAPSTLTERIAGARHLDRQRGRRVDEHVGVRDQPTRVGGVPDVAAELLDPIVETRVLERHEIERPHVVPVRDEPTSEMQAEEPGPAGDRHEHGRKLAARQRLCYLNTSVLRSSRTGRANGALRLTVHRRRGPVDEDGGDEQHRQRNGALAEQAAPDRPRGLTALEPWAHKGVVERHPRPAPRRRARA